MYMKAEFTSVLQEGIDLEENFFMERNILNCYEGLGQYTTFYFGSRLIVSAMCSSCWETEAFVSKDHFEALGGGLGPYTNLNWFFIIIIIP